MRVLFICSRNKLRSPTAEAIFADYPGIEASSAGTSPDAENPVSLDQLEWAEIIFAMEQAHLQKLKAKFPRIMSTKKVVVLKIQDRYAYMDAELVDLLKQKVAHYLKL
jgi:predicted protein tyrosine phosphatase